MKNAKHDTSSGRKIHDRRHNRREKPFDNSILLVNHNLKRAFFFRAGAVEI